MLNIYEKPTGRHGSLMDQRGKCQRPAIRKQKHMKSPPAGREALPASRIELVLCSILEALKVLALAAFGLVWPFLPIVLSFIYICWSCLNRGRLFRWFYVLCNVV